MAKEKDRVEIPIDDDATGAPGLPTDADALLARVAELEQRLATAEEVAAREKLELLRRAADLDNARKRFQRDHERACAAAARGVVERMLPLLEDLGRAAAAADQDGAAPTSGEAFKRLERRLWDVLKAEGLEAIPCERGTLFDPEVHEAVAATCEPGQRPGVVLAVLSPGYLFQGDLLKPVKVEVCVEPKGAA